ncbi:hypothetical protein RUND412_000768 [Rhizina undulata]
MSTITSNPYTLPTGLYGPCAPCLWFDSTPACSWQWLAIIEACQKPVCTSTYDIPLSLTSLCSGSYSLGLPEATMTSYGYLHSHTSAHATINTLHFAVPSTVKETSLTAKETGTGTGSAASGSADGGVGSCDGRGGGGGGV